MKNRGRGGSHRGRGRGRGGYHQRPSATPEQRQERAAEMETERASQVRVPNAFEVSFPQISRIRERGRGFCISGHTFVVVERSIGGLDDIIYNNNRDVWEHLSRGSVRVFSVLPMAPSSVSEPTYECVAAVNGLRKFGYSDSSYGYHSRITHVIAMEKENGECGHIGAFQLGEAASAERYWVVGSKNVHIILRYDIPEEDLTVYSGQRYGYALKIARLWKQTLQGNTAENNSRFHKALAEKQWTACFESIFADSQHLVDYHGINELRFYAVTQARLPSEDGLCLGVLAAKELYASVGLYFSHHSALVPVPSAEYDALVDDIARRGNSEGCVMYGYAGSDAARGPVVCMWKEKSYPYVMERITREAITSHRLAGKELRARIQKRLAMQLAELRKFFSEWERDRMPWLIDFGAWLQVTKVLTPGLSRDAIFDIRNHWLSLQSDFKDAVESDPEVLELCQRYQPDPAEWGDSTELDVVMFVGAQGCGKSTISRALFVLLTNAGYKPRWVNQDEAGNRNNFLAWIRQATSADSGVTHLLLDKMNLDARMREDYKELTTTVTVGWEHPDGVEATIAECVKRVVERAAGHRTIRLPDTLTSEQREKEVKNTCRFISGAVLSCDIPEDDTVTILDLTNEPAQMVQSVWEKLQVSGIHALPDVTSTEVSQALELSMRYEQLLSDQPKAPVYACILILDPAALLRLVPSDHLSGKVLQAQFHITTKYFVGDSDPIYFVKLAELLGKEIDVTLLRVVSDDKGTAIVVRREHDEFPCANAIAHITVANRKGVPPKYSNALCAAEAGNKRPSGLKVVELPRDCTVKGVFMFR